MRTDEKDEKNNKSNEQSDRIDRFLDGVVWFDKRTPPIPSLGLGGQWWGASVVALGATGGSYIWNDALQGALLAYIYVFFIAVVLRGGPH